MIHNSCDYLIIGGGIAGTTAAETIRKQDPAGTITIVGEEPYNLYSRINLSKPNVFLGKIPLESLQLKKDEWYAQNRITLLIGKRAASIDIDSKTVALASGESISYGKLLIATGGVPNRLGIPGEDKNNIFVLRTIDDAKRIIEALGNTTGPAAVVGGGFIGFEMCELLRLSNRPTTILIRENHYWQPLLEETSGRLIERALTKGGVEIRLNAQAQSFEGSSTVESIKLADNSSIPATLVIVGVGAGYNLDFIKAAGIKTAKGVIANEFLETSAQDVWAAGDIAEYQDPILGSRVQLGNWVNAQEQGRAVGANMAGNKKPFRFVSFYTTQGFGIAIAFVGDVRASEGKEVVFRGDGNDGSFGRLIVKDGELVGATLINRTSEMGVIRQLIEKDIKVEDKLKELADTSTPLTSLVK